MPKTSASNTELSNPSLSNAGLPHVGLTDTELLQRISSLYNEAFVATVAKELADARKLVKAGLAEESIVIAQIHERFTYRMHDLGEFMKGLLQRYTQWHNRVHERSGRLWEDRFKSVIVEDGVAARTMAAYIDLNPVRAGLVKDPAEYRWSSYGEAIGGGAKGNGKTARAGLVRAWGAHKGMLADAALWSGEVSRAYRKMLMAHAVEKTSESIGPDGAQNHAQGHSKGPAQTTHARGAIRQRTTRWRNPLRPHASAPHPLLHRRRGDRQSYLCR
jgi:hypothetical protein